VNLHSLRPSIQELQPGSALPASSSPCPCNFDFVPAPLSDKKMSAWCRLSDTVSICSARQSLRYTDSVELVVVGLPRCSGVTHVDAGDTTSLACEASYAGNDQPQLNWYKQVHRRHRLFDDVRPSQATHGHPVNSFDEFDIGVARQVSCILHSIHDRFLYATLFVIVTCPLAESYRVG